jgi:flagellar motor switch protein FliM
MAEQILTQNEVDALLKGLSNGEIKTEADAPHDSGGVRPYDFHNPEKAVRGRMSVLEMVHEKFCRHLRGSVFNLLRKTIDCAPDGIKAMKYEEFMRNLHMPSSLNIFSFQPLKGSGLLAIDPSLAFLIVDSYFGGDGRFHTRVEGRDFTPVELSVIKKVVDIIFHEITEVWKAIYPVEFKFFRSEMNPHFVNIMSANDIVIVSTFRMEIEAVNNRFYVCMPFASLEPIKDKLYGTEKVATAEVDKKWSARLREQFDLVQIGISGEIGEATISFAELLNLRAGDIIELDKKVKEPLEVNIEGAPKLYARPGVIDNHYAVKILSVIKEGG